MKKGKNRIVRQDGFSLAETLVALIIILLVSAVVAAGLPAAKDAYVKVLESSGAQLFLSTTLSELRNELSTASIVDVQDNSIKYYDPINGETVLSFDAAAGCFKIKSYIDLTTTVSGVERERPLVSKPDKYGNRTINYTIKFNSSGSSTAKPFERQGANTIAIGAFSVETTNGKMAELENPYIIEVLVPIPTPSPTP